MYAVGKRGKKEIINMEKKRHKTKDKEKHCSGKTHLAALLISKEYLSSIWHLLSSSSNCVKPSGAKSNYVQVCNKLFKWFNLIHFIRTYY